MSELNKNENTTETENLNAEATQEDTTPKQDTAPTKDEAPELECASCESTDCELSPNYQGKDDDWDGDVESEDDDWDDDDDEDELEGIDIMMTFGELAAIAAATAIGGLLIGLRIGKAIGTRH